ncbi:hypothetical protein, partial [Leisingera aquimarina]|uniref:hypothetical protein n=1 Tax=Leisingera aquimarina TaxID=476529 RepID=UPI001B7FA8F2
MGLAERHGAASGLQPFADRAAFLKAEEPHSRTYQTYAPAADAGSESLKLCSRLQQRQFSGVADFPGPDIQNHAVEQLQTVRSLDLSRRSGPSKRSRTHSGTRHDAVFANCSPVSVKTTSSG